MSRGELWRAPRQRPAQGDPSAMSDSGGLKRLEAQQQLDHEYEKNILKTVQ